MNFHSSESGEVTEIVLCAAPLTTKQLLAMAAIIGLNTKRCDNN